MGFPVGGHFNSTTSDGPHQVIHAKNCLGILIRLSTKTKKDNVFHRHLDSRLLQVYEQSSFDFTLKYVSGLCVFAKTIAIYYKCECCKI